MNIRRAAFGLLFLFLAAALVVLAQAAVKIREFNGQVTIQICERDSAGKWQVVDQVLVPQLRFTGNVTESPGGNQFTSAFVLNARTKNGKDFAMRVTRPGSAETNLQVGSSTFDFPVEITIAGQKANAVFKMTTESTQGPNGTINGRRAIIDLKSQTAQVLLVGSATVRILQLPRLGAKPKDGQEDVTPAGPKETLFVIQADARPLKALN
jgi:hypothetical protein